MLVLTRKIGESVVIGDHIVVAVVNIRGDQAKIGVAAPDHVPVDRSEVRDGNAAAPRRRRIP
jgi:carbon storage regulator